MRVFCVGYREWALNIYDALAKSTDHVFLILRSKKQFDVQLVEDFKPDFILFYGWSWIVPSQLLDKYMCVMLHPSPLPYYRGGSPIQNQIIEGETTSMVSLFIMTEKLDAGDLIGQEEFSLEGTLNDIFLRIEMLGIKLTKNILDNNLERLAQDNTKATYFNRRTPADSQITFQEIATMPAKYLHNKIRMLADPYPNAYIIAGDGEKLYITNSRL